MNSIPFRLPDVGLREISGVVYLDQEFLVLEVEDALLGEVDREEQTVKVEPSAVQEIRLDRSVLGDKLCIRPKKRDLLRVMPGTYTDELCLKLRKKYRERAEQLVDDVRRRSRKD